MGYFPVNDTQALDISKGKNISWRVQGFDGILKFRLGVFLQEENA